MSDLSNTISMGLGTITTDTYDYINNLISSPSVIVLFVVVIVLYIIVFMAFGSGSGSTTGLTDDYDLITSSTSSSSSSSGIIMAILAALFLALIIINGFQYIFGLDIVATLKNLFTSNPELDITVDTLNTNAPPIPEIMLTKQVFNIPNNDYIYPDAKALCSAYGARLATYKEVEDSYNDGGEWCNYGWSDGQMALFPTQQKTFDKLQTIDGHENDCGRPGVNGGYIANPKVKFGVNCYGYKPRMTPTEEELMETMPIYPKTMKDIAMENRVSYWKNKLTEVLVSPFNHNSWSKL
jgi:hypothetical protein